MVNTKRKKRQLLTACFLILLGSMVFRVHTSDSTLPLQSTPEMGNGLSGIQPLKETSALATEAFTASLPQVVSLRTQQQQFQQQEQQKYQLLHGQRPKMTVRPKQANKVTTTFCRKNSFPVDYFIYFLQEIII